MDKCLFSIQMIHALLKIPVTSKGLRIKNTLVSSADIICFRLSQLQIYSSNLVNQNLENFKIHFHISVYLYSEIFFQSLIQKIHSSICVSRINTSSRISRNGNIKISHKRGQAYSTLILVQCGKNHGIGTLTGLSLSFVLSDQQNTLDIAGISFGIRILCLYCICKRCTHSRAFQKQHRAKTDKGLLPYGRSHIFAPMYMCMVKKESVCRFFHNQQSLMITVHSVHSNHYFTTIVRTAPFEALPLESTT